MWLLMPALLMLALAQPARGGSMDPLPSWLIMQSENPVLRSVLGEMFQNPKLRGILEGMFAPEGRPPFPTVVGDAAGLERLNASRPKNTRTKIPRGIGAASVYSAEPDSSVHAAGIFVDVDRIHSEAKGDSARARVAVRDAVLHELAHLLPLAEQRHLRAATGDPKPGDKNVADHPVIQGENRLRDLFGLAAKTTYGLFQ
jgi:hypothetical protein